MDRYKIKEGASTVSLEDMLEARERRSSIQRELLSVWKRPLICFTLNIPGEYKVFPLVERCFEEGKTLILRLLGKKSITYWEVRVKTGLEGYFIADGNAREIKMMLLPLEESHPLGRLFDIDVFEPGGSALHRTDLGQPERSCLVCGKPVWACARSRAHASEDLLWSAVQLLNEYFDGQIADLLAQLAIRALMTEVCVTPKPGLVDRADNGSHDDMNIFRFIDSSCALFGYFRNLTLFCLRYEGEYTKLLSRIRFHGLLAEDAMLVATNGVNTQKGALFTLGLLCAAAGILYGRGEVLTEDSLCELCRIIAEPVEVELTTSQQRTNGEAAFLNYGIRGVRGEAILGFPNVRSHALPVLRALLGQGYTLDEAAVVALLHLIAHVDDTNIIARAGLPTLRGIQVEIGSVLERERDVKALLAYADELNTRFIPRRISPGGCADLLSAAIFVNSLLTISANPE